MLNKIFRQSVQVSSSFYRKMISVLSNIMKGTISDTQEFIIRNEGFCITCDSNVIFSSTYEWLRDHYICSNCSSIPRERALMYCIEQFYPNWKDLAIHETSPVERGASRKLKQYCPRYSVSQFFPDAPLGKIHTSGFRNENLEQLTFEDETFDLFISQDVMEHIFHPEKAFAEIARVLKPGGAHIFTVPLVNKNKPTEIRASKDADGTIMYFGEPEYHGNPVDDAGSLVTRRWGYDIADFIFEHSGLYSTIIYIDNIELGIRAEYIEVLMSRKLKK